MLSDDFEVEVPIGPRGRRARRQRRVRRLAQVSGVVVLVAAMVGFLALRRPAPVDAEGPQAVRSTGGAGSTVTVDTATPDADSQIRSLRAVAPPTTVADSSSSTAPAEATATGVAAETKAATTDTAADRLPVEPAATEPAAAIAPEAPVTSDRPAAAPSTTAPPTTAPPTTAPPTTAPPTTAAPTTAPPTTAAPKPAGTQRGQATWYRWKAGNCAHNTLPKGTVVTVTAVASGRTATCVVGDRGAFKVPTIIDLDATVFAKIAPLGAGRIEVAISW